MHASELLGVEQRPRQVGSPNSSSNLPHNAFGVAVPAASREEGGTDAKAESDTLTPVSRIEVGFQEDPESPLPEVKKEESSNESQARHQGQRSRSREPSERRSCVPENDQRVHVTE